jgi:phosphomevalonate kinase
MLPGMFFIKAMSNLKLKNLKNAIKKCNGFYLGVAKCLGCSSPTAIKYVNKWEDTKELFLISQIVINEMAIERYIEALDNGEQWAIDRILKRMPEEGLSPEETKKETKIEINIQDEFKKLADSLEATEIKKPDNES